MATKRKRQFRSPALQHTYNRFIALNPELVEQYEEEVINAEIARKIYDLRPRLDSASVSSQKGPLQPPSSAFWRMPIMMGTSLDAQAHRPGARQAREDSLLPAKRLRTA
jgi:hypothetical protein